MIGVVVATATAAWAKVLLEYRVEGSRVVGWTALAPEGHRMDGRVRFRGQPSLAVSRTEANRTELPFGCRWVSRPVQVAPGEAYTVCAQARAADVTAGAVGFQVNFYATAEQARRGAYTKEAVSDALIGEATDWTFVAHTFVVPEGRQFAVVWCRTNAAFVGRAWFSHVRVFKGDALPVPVVETPPVIDGDLGDEVWTRATECRGFYLRGQRVDSPPTIMRLLFTDKMVCLAADCEEPAIDRLLQAATANDDSNIWRDDGIELFTATQVASRTYHQFIFNTLGRYTDLHRRRIQWNARDVKVKAAVHEDRWTLEIGIPLSNFRTAFMPGQDERGLR